MNRSSIAILVALLVFGLLAFAGGTPGQEADTEGDVGADAAADAGVANPLANVNPHGTLSVPCADCHTTEGWQPLIDPLPFDHASTGFPLIAAHRGVGCMECHGDLEFLRVASACADCHQDPHLGELGLGCADCHDPRGWAQARHELRLRHATTLFPLTGAHAAADCASCHRGTPALEFAGTPTSCYPCHVADFRQASNPNHVLAGFSLGCEECHGNTERWRGAEFRLHDPRYFPIFSGTHVGIWDSCSDCHASSATFAVVTCFLCHGLEETTAQHRGVRGFVYDTAACLACHPTGVAR